MSSSAPNVRLIVFSDDWGRHPSSCQHLVGRLLSKYPVLWVNTIGTRVPGLSWSDARKVFKKLWQWTRPPEQGPKLPANLTVVTPRMYPGFRKPWQRRLNARLVSDEVNFVLRKRPRDASELRVVITTLPITADMVGKIDADRWVYYCVDDFSVWPGLDGPVMQEMERQQVAKMDALLAVSETLAGRLSGMGWPGAPVLTHGIDLAHWSSQTEQASEAQPLSTGAGRAALPDWWPSLARPIMLFWGLIDARLDAAWCRALGSIGGTLVLVGPTQGPDASLGGMAHVKMPGPVAYDDLPALAQHADVLVMPYADLPVTRAMQPLKFKEYLAAGHPGALRPVVVRDLPATRPWSDAADVVSDMHAFVDAVKLRIATGLPHPQRVARKRLETQTWDAKAIELENIMLNPQPTPAG